MKEIKTIIFACLILALSINISRAQSSYEPGYVILTNGSRIAGSMLLYDDAPWFNQRFVFLKDSVELSSNKDAKPKKYKVADLKFFQVGARQFDKIHFVDLENLQLKSLGSNDHMLERLAKGRINAHRFYSYSPDYQEFEGMKSEYEEFKRNNKNALLAGYKILISKNNETTVKNAFDADMLKYFEDTPEVSKKYQSGGYGNEPIVAKKGLAAKMVAMAKKAAFKPQEATAIIAAIKDYNEKNPMKK